MEELTLKKPEIIEWIIIIIFFGIIIGYVFNENLHHFLDEFPTKENCQKAYNFSENRTCMDYLQGFNNGYKMCKEEYLDDG